MERQRSGANLLPSDNYGLELHMWVVEHYCVKAAHQRRPNSRFRMKAGWRQTAGSIYGTRTRRLKCTVMPKGELRPMLHLLWRMPPLTGLGHRCYQRGVPWRSHQVPATLGSGQH